MKHVARDRSRMKIVGYYCVAWPFLEGMKWNLRRLTLGSLLRFKSSLDEWENVLNSEIWEMEEAKVDIFPHLLLSYNELSPTLKRCFSYCAVGF
ncbi:hypothetical protein ACS0TY_020700 [Phlomoides rotata]